MPIPTILDDDLLGTSLADLIDLLAGNDRFEAKDGDDTVDGNEGNDTMIGGNGGDIMLGGGGNDTLNGNGGLDTMDGGLGDDLLNGGANPDTFVFGTVSNDDTIDGFQNGLDVIDLSALALGGFAALTAPGVITASGASSTLIDLSLVGGNGTILLDGIAPGVVDATDFVF
jgi:Ca2+-binding RTX toxin-like protein